MLTHTILAHCDEYHDGTMREVHLWWCHMNNLEDQSWRRSRKWAVWARLCSRTSMLATMISCDDTCKQSVCSWWCLQTISSIAPTSKCNHDHSLEENTQWSCWWLQLCFRVHAMILTLTNHTRVHQVWTNSKINHNQIVFFIFKTVVCDTQQQKHKAIPCNSTISWIWK